LPTPPGTADLPQFFGVIPDFKSSGKKIFFRPTDRDRDRRPFFFVGHRCALHYFVFFILSNFFLTFFVKFILRFSLVLQWFL